MDSIINLILSTLYVKLRGKSFTTTTITDNTLTHVYCGLNSKGENANLTLLCHQFQHDIEYEKWYMTPQKLYTYRVQVMVLHNFDFHISLPVSTYPHMCAEWLANTTYPLHCAVRAYIDEHLTHPAVLRG
jgi:hypothetical protein